MRNIWILALALCFSSAASFGQHPGVKQFTAPRAGKVVLSEVEDKYNAQVYSTEMPDPDAAVEQKKLQAIKAQVRKTYPYRKAPAQKKTTSVPQPTVSISFVADSMPGIPPDNYSAVSKGNQAVTVMNDLISVHDATTGAYQVRKSLYTFSKTVGLNNSVSFQENYRYDPKVVYDPVADRFICVMLNGIDQYNWIVVGFSQTNNPDSAWVFYKFYGDYAADSTWFDYPSVSITQNELFITGNKIIYDDSWQAGFTKSVVYQVRKREGYDGDTALVYQLWDSVTYDNKYLRCLAALNPGDALQGPAQYFISNRNFDISNDSVFVVGIPDTIGSGNYDLSVTPVISSIPYGVPPDARQPDTSLTLATNDGRVLGGFIRGNEIQFVSTSVSAATGASAVYHGVISNFPASPALTGHIFGIDTLDMGYPNISYAANTGGANQSIISFNYSGPNTFPAFGAIFFDGGSYSDMLTITGGDSTINMLGQKEQRWGDYSGSQPDWNQIGAVWVEGIFGRKDRKYGNYMARLVSPFNDAVPPLQLPAAKNSNLFPNPAMQFVHFEFTVDKEQTFSFMIYDMQGRVVDKLTDRYCPEGKNVIQFNIASLPQGTYLLKAIGGKGERIAIHNFVKE